MEHIKIIQNNTLADVEEVSQEIIQKLYDLAVSGDLDASSEMKGRLHLTVGYRVQAEYLHQMFPNLIISIDNYIIPFEDPKMVTYLNSIGVGSNGVITESDAAAATVVANSQNTEVTKFNELRYFTGITESRGGWTGSNEGTIQFYNWTALEEVDISNFTSIGHRNGSAWRDTFRECSALKKVIASNKLLNIGYGAFKNCQNLEEITGLSGNILLYEDAFLNCRKLKNSSFINCSFNFVDNNSRYAFQNCELLTSITIASGETYIPDQTFRGCSALTTINIPSSITSIGAMAFYSCSALASADLSSITTIGANAFEGCTSLSGELNMPALTTLNGYGQYFRNCKSLTKVKCLGKIDTINAGMFQCSSGTPALQEVYLPYECTTIKNDTFTNCANLTTIKQYNKSIDQYADDEQPVFNFISRITSFGQGCFSNCSSLTLTTNDVINAVTIGTGAFSNSGLSGDLSFPYLETIGVYPFQKCPITSVDLTGSTVTTIGGGFINQSPCDHIILPDTLTKIDGSDNFHSQVLRWVKCPCTTPPTLNNSNCFRNMPNTTKIYVPDASLSTYQSAEIWSSISTQIKPLSDFATDFPNG